MDESKQRRPAPRSAFAATSWIRRSRPNPGAAVRLFCIPYAGGAASVFHAWAAELPASVELTAIELPGRGARLRQPALTRVDEAARGIADAIAPDLDRPYALFGHSFGAVLSFELVRELRRRGAAPPILLIASARRAPHLPKRSAFAHRLSDADLAQHLRELKGTPEEVLASAELMDLVLPIVRADLTADETYVCREDEPLEVPIRAFGGTDDTTFPPEDLAAWAVHTRGGFDLELFPGDHFFVHAERARVLERIAWALGAAGGTADAGTPVGLR